MSQNSSKSCGKKRIPPPPLLGIKLGFPGCLGRRLIALLTKLKKIKGIGNSCWNTHLELYPFYPLHRLWQIIRVSRKLERHVVLALLQNAVSANSKTIFCILIVLCEILCVNAQYYNFRVTANNTKNFHKR